MKLNPLTCIDYYKADHRRQYPTGTTLVYSNFTPRSVKYLPKIEGTDDKVVFFGLQYFIKHFLIEVFNEGFFKLKKETVVGQYKRRMDTSLGKDAIPIDHIQALHDLGYLPISIRALPEGAIVKEKIPLFTIENTLPEFFWLVNYLETILSAFNWKSCTSATIARKYKQLATKFYEKTGADKSFIQFAFHDFSFRGMGGPQDAVMSGAAHLLSFVGTDTVAAIDFLEQYYGADAEKELIGCSVPATEHSVMCMGGKDDEIKTFERLITELYPKGIVSIVSDTWDFWSVVRPGDGIMAQLKDKVMARSGGLPVDRVVIRPDSGDPVKIIVGDQEAEPGTPEFKGAVQCLWETFGGTETSNGYKVLDSHVGLIYGDSITLQRAEAIFRGLQNNGFAASNVVFGIGSYTYVYQTRDTLGFAMKATAGEVNGKFVEIFKDPVTDDGFKKSAKGYLAVYKDVNGELYLKDQVTLEEKNNSELKEVFRDGTLLIEHKLSDIRARL